MKKHLLLAFLLLIAWPNFSQEDTQGIKLSFQVAKRVALDLVELNRMKEEEIVQQAMLENLQISLVKASQVNESKTKQILLLEDSLDLLKFQLDIVQKKKIPRQKILPWILATGAAFGAGFILASG